jgi:hypothetical protein
MLPFNFLFQPISVPFGYRELFTIHLTKSPSCVPQSASFPAEVIFLDITDLVAHIIAKDITGQKDGGGFK